MERAQIVRSLNKHLKRSNAMRIKSKDLRKMVQISLQKVIQNNQFDLTSSDDDCDDHHEENTTTDEDDELEELSLLQQIKRGVRLRPISETSSRDKQRRSKIEAEQDSSLSAMLIRVLRQRYLAIQQTDDEHSELSSIDASSLPNEVCYQSSDNNNCDLEGKQVP